MITFDYKITKLLIDENQIVRFISGTVTATDGEGNVVSKELKSPTNEPDFDSLIPYDELEEQTVIDWLKDLHHEAISELLAFELYEARLNSLEGDLLPWANNG